MTMRWIALTLLTVAAVAYKAGVLVWSAAVNSSNRHHLSSKQNTRRSDSHSQNTGESSTSVLYQTFVKLVLIFKDNGNDDDGDDDNHNDNGKNNSNSDVQVYVETTAPKTDKSEPESGQMPMPMLPSKKHHKKKKEQKKKKSKPDRTSTSGSSGSDNNAKKKANDNMKNDKHTAKRERSESENAYTLMPYPGCEQVDTSVTYAKTLLSWNDHQVAANAQHCQLASVHSMAANSMISKAALFEFSSGMEIAEYYTSSSSSSYGEHEHDQAAVVLKREFWLGAYDVSGNTSTTSSTESGDNWQWRWTDGTPWDFGPTFSTSSEKNGRGRQRRSSPYCLKASIKVTEMSIVDITPEDHWMGQDCNTLLPAIYKCCASSS